VDGVAQKPIEGVSMAYTFDKANTLAPSKHATQYFEMMGVRGLYHEGWMLSTVPVRPPWDLVGAAMLNPANAFQWELYDVSKDPGETRNLLAEKKAVGEEMRSQLAGLIRQYSAGQELAEKTGLDPALMERLKSLGYAGFSGGSSPTVSDRNLPDPKDRIQTYEIFSDAMSDSQHGQYPQSVEKLNAVLKIEPESVPAHYLQGLNYYRMQEFAKAVTEFERVLQLSPDYALAAFHLGLAYARTGQFDNAIASFKRTLELDGTNFSAAYDLGLSYVQKQMTNEAAAAFRQSISVAPDYAPAHRALGELLLSQGDVDDALKELRLAAELNPADPGTHQSLAKALTSKGLGEQAQQEMRKAQQARPQ